MDDFLDNVDAYKLEGMDGIASIFQNLFVSPYDVDNHLLLTQDRKRNDYIKRWIYELIDEKSVNKEVTQTGVKSKTPRYQNMDPLHALMSTGLNFEHTWENQLGTEVKMAGLGNAILGFLTKKAFDLKVIDGKNLRTVKEIKEFVVNKLQTKFKYKGNPIYLLRKSEMYMQLDAFGATGGNLTKYVQVAPYAGRKDWLRIYQDSKNVHVEIEDGNKMISMPIEYDVEVSNQDVDLNKLNQKAAKILNSKAFASGIAGLQMINMYSAITEWNDKRDVKTKVNAIGVSADLAEAILNVQKARLIAQGVEVGASHGVVKWASRFGAIGGFATSVMCVWDSVDAFNKSDVDAGVAWAGAGVAYGVSTVMATFCSGAALAGPIGLIAAGVGLGLVVLANVLTDTDLEYYFKHFLLCDRVVHNKETSMLPGNYTISILKKRVDLMGDDPEQIDKDTIMNPYDAQIRLWDLLVCTQMQFKPVESQITTTTSYSTIGPVSNSTIKYYSFEVSMQFMQFLDIDSHIETHAFLYPAGFNNGNPIDISAKRSYEINVAPKKATQLKIELSIPQEERTRVSESSDILFAIKVSNNDHTGTTFPFKASNSSIRYIGAKADLGTYTLILGTNQKEEVRIGTLEQLKGEETINGESIWD